MENGVNVLCPGIILVEENSVEFDIDVVDLARKWWDKHEISLTVAVVVGTVS
jgi:predicted solute-binding protein